MIALTCPFPPSAKSAEWIFLSVLSVQSVVKQLFQS